jgi:esterase/lipase
MTLRQLLHFSIILVSALVTAVLFFPVRLLSRASRTAPAKDFQQSFDCIQEILNGDSACAGPLGRTIFLSHDHKQKTVVLLFHGYTKSPHQFNRLGRQLFERGCNVFVPRMPHHGLRDRMSKEHSRITARQLARWGHDMIDCASGLGESVIIAGISAGGTVAAWCALSRDDIAKAVIISPVFGFYGFPLFSLEPLMKFLLRLPNFFRWWDPVKRAGGNTPAHVYPRYATRTLGELLRLGFSIQKALSQNLVSNAPVTFVVNPNDHTVLQKATDRIMARWQKISGELVTRFEFPAEKGLPHDIVDPASLKDQTEHVHTTLVEILVSPVRSRVRVS